MELKPKQLLVKYKDHFVGLLTSNEMSKIIEFNYDADFIKTGIELSPAIMPLSNKTYLFDGLDSDVFKKLPPMFSDSLPDRFGNILFQKEMERRNIHPQDMNVLFRLGYLGKRGVGALEYFPEFSQNTPSQIIDLVEIQKLIKQIYEEKFAKVINYSKENNEALNYLMNFGASIGGARPKMFIGLDEAKGKMVSGDSEPTPGMNYYLIKLNFNSDNSDTNQYGKIEYGYYQMVRDCGIDMMHSNLWNNEHFYTQRFDRDEQGNKWHYQTFNSLFGLSFNEMFSYSYEQFFKELSKLNVPQQDLDQLYRRMCFNVILVNRDDHLKNFAMILKNNEWRLSPAYDMCYSYDPLNKWVSEQTLSVNGKRTEITERDLVAVGIKHSIKNAKQIVQQVQEVASKFKNYMNDLDVPKHKVKEMIEVISSQSVFDKSKNNFLKR